MPRRGLRIDASFDPRDFAVLLLSALQQAGCIAADVVARAVEGMKPGEKLETEVVQAIDIALREFQKRWVTPKDELPATEWAGIILVAILLNSADLSVSQVILTAEPGPFTWRERVNHLVDLLIKGDTAVYRAALGDGRRSRD